MMAQKTVLITGASRGIGKAIAVKFAKKNYNVVINCIQNEERLLQTKREIESYQVSCLASVSYTHLFYMINALILRYNLIYRSTNTL